MSSQRVTVFGGTGFLGRRIVRHLHDADFVVRIASRHPERGLLLFSGDVPDIETVRADANDEASVATAVSGAWAVVNAVSLYVEHGNCTFQSVHVEAARRIALLARQAGVETFAHVSGIGADAGSASPYIRSRGHGEAAVLDAFPSATLIRPGCHVRIRRRIADAAIDHVTAYAGISDVRPRRNQAAAGLYGGRR